MKNNFKRCLALLLALMSIVGSFAIPVSAAEACDHDWEEYKTVAPTCTTVGYTTYVCKLCSESKTENLVAKLNHTWVKMDTMKDSNCTNPGYKAGAEVCSVCNTVKKAEDVIAPKDNPTLKDHVWDETKTRKEGALCDANGIVTTYKTCSLCKKEFEYEKVTNAAGTGHNYKPTIVTPATCTADGKVVQTCATCGDSYEVKVTKLNHPESSWSDWTYYNKEITVSGTKYTPNKNNCIEVKYCGECNGIVAAQQKVAHDYKCTSDVTNTCNAPGYTKWTCKNCAYVDKRNVTLAHEYNASDPKEVVKGVHKVDQLVEGYSLYVCLKCGEDVKVPEAGYQNAANFHTIGATGSKLVLDNANAVDPTCTEQGYGRYNCSGCAYTVVAPIAATGHKWTKYNAGDAAHKIVTGTKADGKDESASCKDPYKVVAVCDNCDYKETKINYPAATNHKVDQALTGAAYDVKGTCFAEGYKVYGCDTCKKEVTRKVGAAAGNDYKKLSKGHNSSKWMVVSNGSTGCFTEREEWTVCTKCSEYATYDAFKAAALNNNAFKKDGKGYTYTSSLERAHLYSKVEVIEVPTCHTTGSEGYKCARKFEDVNETGKKTKVECGAKEIQNILDFDRTNHTGGKSADATKGYYDVTNQKGALVTGELLNITEFKKDANVTGIYDCYQLSYTWWYCEGCDKEFTEVTTKTVGTGNNAVTYVSGSQVHIWGTVTFAENGEKDSTCTDTGLGRRECTICHKVEKNCVIPAKGHNTTNKVLANDNVPAVPSDCKNYGFAIYKCENAGCGATIRVDETELSTTHDYGSWTVVTAPTCADKGQDKRTCKICGKVDPRESAKVAHGTIAVKVNNVDTLYTTVAASAAKCGVAGWSEFKKCAKCNEYYTGTTALGKDLDAAKANSAVKIAALSHDADTTGAVVGATCTTYGYNSYKCSKCGIEREWRNFTDKLEHIATLDSNNKPVVGKKKATCYAYAYSYNTCSRCNEEFNIIEDKSQIKPPHVNNTSGYPLTGDCRVILGDENCTVCKGTGVNCAKCAEAYTCTNKKADGTTVCGVVVPAQCAFVNPVEYEECNAIVSECKFCGETKNELIDATAAFTHKFEVTVAPTTKTEGEEACKVCGYVNPTPVARLSAVTFSMNAYNPNGGNIVNGGYVYVDVNMKTLEAIDVNNIRVAIKFNTTDLIFSGIVGNESVFGNVSSEPEANDQAGVVYVFDDAGRERFNITLEGDMKFVTLAFYVKPGRYDDKNRLASELEFTADVPDDYAPSVSYYDAEKKAYSDYTFDIKTNAKIDLAVDQLGDVNNDGKINNYDLVAVRDAMAEGAAYDAVLDIDHDGEITIKDYKLIKEYMVAKYEYWQFADIDSFNAFVEYAAKKNNIDVNEETDYITWLETEKA